MAPTWVAEVSTIREMGLLGLGCGCQGLLCSSKACSMGGGGGHAKACEREQKTSL